MEEKHEMEKSTNNQVRLRLTFDVNFEDNEGGLTPAQIERIGRSLLQGLVDTAMNRGEVTGGTSLEVESHDVRVSKLDAAAADLTPQKILDILADCELSVPAAGNRNAVFVELARRIQSIEREQCAKLCQLRPDNVRLLVGEMSVGTMKAVQAVLGSRARAMLARVAGDTLL